MKKRAFLIVLVALVVALVVASVAWAATSRTAGADTGGQLAA